LVPTPTVHLYGNGYRIVNEKGLFDRRPGLIREQGVVSKPLPAFFSQMRHHRAEHLNEDLRRLPNRPGHAGTILAEGGVECAGKLVDLRHGHVETEGFDVLTDLGEGLVRGTAQRVGIRSELAG